MSTHILHDIFLAQIIYFLPERNQTRLMAQSTNTRTAAVSTPVGPPPQTTKLSNLLRSSGVVVGRLAVSKLSVYHHKL
jgi:hypothetical protein